MWYPSSFLCFRNDLSSSLCTLDLKLNTVNHNHLYISTDAGIILHSTRFGTQKTVPRCYMSDDSTPCVVTSLDLHPFGHPVLLVNFSIICNRFHIHMEKLLKLSEDWVLQWPILVPLSLYILLWNSVVFIDRKSWKLPSHRFWSNQLNTCTLQEEIVHRNLNVAISL